MHSELSSNMFKLYTVYHKLMNLSLGSLPTLHMSFLVYGNFFIPLLDLYFELAKYVILGEKMTYMGQKIGELPETDIS